MEYYSYTNKGLVRRNNEDSALALPSKGIFAVADGLGGHSAGEIASSEAVAVIRDFNFSDRFPAEEEIYAAVREANNRILALSGQKESYRGMGTTISLLLLRNLTAEIGHVGDSRIYHLEEGALRRITKDHTLAQEWLDTGKIESELDPEHSANHIVTRALGTKADIEIDYLSFPVKEKDLLFLCTDGVNKHISDEELGRFLTAGNMDLDAIGNAITRTILERGASDNFTYIILIV